MHDTTSQTILVTSRVLDHRTAILGIPASVFQASLPMLFLSVMGWWFTPLTLKLMVILNIWWMASFWIASNGGDAYQLLAPCFALFYRRWYLSCPCYKEVLQ